MDINVIILAYRRLDSLERLLSSLEDTCRKGFVNLCISCDGGSADAVRDFAQNYSWDLGSYNFIQQDENLGVRGHNLWAIGQAAALDNCLILEDDLLLAPFAMDYIRHMANQVLDDRIVGIALYRYGFIDHHHLPFVLIPDGNFVYYQQRPCSNGCFYKADWAKDFLQYMQLEQADEACDLPIKVRAWDADKSWQKDYYCYLQKGDKYLLFPRYSLSTDFGKAGANMKRAVDQFRHHSALYMGDQFAYTSLDESINTYDAHYELLPERVKQLCPALSKYDLCIDLHGGRDISGSKAAYVLSSKSGKAVQSWARKLKPLILNLSYDVKGETLRLMKREDVEASIPKPTKEDFYYYFPDTKIKDLIKMKAKDIWSRLTS